jgi:AcrR family transcriptional regulator
MARPKMKAAEVERVRTSLLDAAVHCWQRHGVDGLGMAEIAAEAGVARSTVYRYFKNRDELVVALAWREVAAASEDIFPHIIAIKDPVEQFVEGLVLAFRILPRRRLLIDLLPQLDVWRSPAMAAVGNAFIAREAAAQGAESLVRQDVPMERLIEWGYRVAVSLLTLPSPWVHDEEELRDTLHKMLIPVLLSPEELAKRDLA